MPRRLLPTNPSLMEYREWLEHRLRQGESHHCRACGQFCKIYHRKLTGAHGRSLIALYRQDRVFRRYHHLPSLILENRLVDKWPSFPEHWGLIEEERILRPDGGRVGFWRLTPLGVAFVRGDVKVPKFCWLYDDHLLGLDDTEGEVSIRDVLGTQFNYEELMEGI